MNKQERLVYMQKRFTALRDRYEYESNENGVSITTIGGLLPASQDDVTEELGVMDTVRTHKKLNSSLVLTSDEISIS